MKVNPLDLKAQYKGIRQEILKVVGEVCDSQHFVLGEHVRGLEAEIAEYTNSKYAIGVASGTDAILLALMSYGIGPGDRVITTPYTFFSTGGSIARLGAEPVFVDIDPISYNIDTEAVEAELKKNSKGIKAIIPVHLYGQSADMTPLLKIARKYGLKVIEDAAQAIGAKYNDTPVGSIGDAGCFSFYPSKNLGGFGDGGMVTARSKKSADMVSMLRVHGCKDRYHHKFVGINSRLDELQAAVLRIKLKHLDAWTEARISNAALYTSLFEKAGLGDKLSTPVTGEGNRHVYNQYVIRVKKRNALKDYLAAESIGSAVYYPIPLHLQDCFKGLGYKKGSLPVSERAARETLALPMYPELSKAKIRTVVKAIAEFYNKG